jgi:polyisoprenoid-binding protein YceI
MTSTDTTATEQYPAAGTWTVEPAHSSANFSVRHLGLSKVRGHFEEIDGTLEIAEDPAQSSVEITINASSIDTNQPDRDNHLRSEDFLHVEEYPTLTFRSTRMERDDDEWKVEGELTIHGVTKPVELEVEYLGKAEDPMGFGERIAFEASTLIIRQDFGLTWEGPQSAAGALVGRKVEIDVDVQFVRAQES